MSVSVVGEAAVVGSSLCQLVAANVPVNSGCCCGSVGDSLAAFGGSLVSSFTQISKKVLTVIEWKFVELNNEDWKQRVKDL